MLKVPDFTLVLALESGLMLPLPVTEDPLVGTADETSVA